MWKVIPLVILVGCPGPTDDTGDPVTCDEDEDATLTLGHGSGETFVPFVGDEVVGLDAAPQGGVGVTIRAKTTGLSTEEPIELQMDVYLDTDLAGSFTIESIVLYCQEDGTGLVWGAVVGFDPDEYSSNDDLLALNGQTGSLEVTATDQHGTTAVGTADVILQVGN